MNFAEHFNNFLTFSKGRKITDRKTALEIMLSLYSKPDAIREITSNTLRNASESVTWDLIISTAHQIILDDKIGKATTNKAMVCNFIEQTFENAKSMLTGMDFAPVIFEILGNQTYAFYHNMYIRALRMYILPVFAYRLRFSSETWQELLKVCINLYSLQTTSKDKSNILKTIQSIVEYGCLESHLILILKKFLPVLESIFKSDSSDQIVAESAIKVTTSVCRQIAMESRFTLCDFGETILPDIIFLSGHTEKYKLFRILVQAHHPKGITLTESASYAKNKQEWKEILQNMFSMIIKECRPEILPLPFVDFASAVFRQISKLPSEDQNLLLKSEYEDEYSQPKKKRRLSTEYGVLVNTINENELKPVWPMIQILANLLKNHPNSLEANEFIQLIRIVKFFFSKLSEHKVVMGSLCQLALEMIPIQDKFTLHDKSLEDKNFGSEILNSLLRYLHTAEDNNLCHRLVQSLIEYGKITNFDVILRAYVTQAMKWTSSSVRTLLLLCRHTTLPEKIVQVDETVSSEPLKTKLLKWLLDIPWQSNFSQFPIDDLTEILSHFPLRFWCKDSSNLSKISRFLFSGGRNLIIQEEASILDEIKPITPDDVDKCHLALAFQIDLLSDLKMVTKSEQLDSKQINPAYRKSDLESLVSELSKLLQVDIKFVNVSIMIMKNMIVARTLSGLKELNLADEIEFNSLFNALQNSLEKVFGFLSELDFSKQRLTDLVQVLNSLSLFFEASYHDTITEGILFCVSQNSLRNLYNILSLEGNSNQETVFYPCPNLNDSVQLDDQKQSPELSRTEIMRFQVTRTLKNYCCLTTNSTMLEIQEHLMTSLIQSNISDISERDIKIAAMLLETATQEIVLSETVFENLIEFLVLLFAEFWRQQKIVRYILRILPYYFKHSIKLGFIQKLLSILLEIHMNINKKIHGPLVHFEFVKCLSELISIDPNLIYLVDANSQSVLHLILQYVNNPFLIVRLEIARTIYTLYSRKEISVQWKQSFYNELITEMTFLEKEKVEETDERASKLVSFLYIIGAVISSNSILQNQALFTLLQFSSSEKIPIKIIQKVLKISGSSLEDNLDYLLIHWCAKESFDSFPCNLIESSSDDFFINQMHIPILRKSRTISEAMDICEKKGLSFEESFKNSFPKIVAWLLFYVSKEENFAKDIFEDLKNNRGEFQLVRRFDELLNETLDLVIMYLIQGIDDEDHFSQIFGVNIVLPESIPVRLKINELDKCLHILEEVLKEALIPFLVGKRKDLLQKILLGLTSNIYDNNKSKTKSPEHKLKNFHHFVYFCSLLMRELKNDYFEDMWIFVVRDICYSLLHLIKDKPYDTSNNQTDLSELACKFLDEFLCQILPERSTAVKEFFILIIRILTPLAASDESSIALQTLKFLIVDQKEVFSDVIKKLNSFPQGLRFKEIRVVHESLKVKYTLESEIEHFLTVTEEINLPSNAGSLLLLKGKLLEKKVELNVIYKKLENLRGFAEDCAKSLLHQLIYRLVKLTESSDPIVSEEAIKCLGILGPGDLTTMILHQKTTGIKEATDGIEMLTYSILILLSNYIIEKDIELRKASSDALYAVLSSPWGQKLMNLKYLNEFENKLDVKDIKLCLDRIRPFMIKDRIKNKKIGINREKFEKIIDPENSVWKDQSNCSYFEWITEFVCKIADSFCNFYLESLIPIFKSNLQFCEEIISRIINILIRLDRSIASDLCDCINRFFRYNCETREEGFQKRGTRNQDSIRCMLNIVNFLRIQDDEGVELRFDYLPIAKAAQFCSAYFTSVLYLELWCETFLNGIRDIEHTLIIDRIYNKDPIQGKIVKDILREASIKIGDPDAVYGCGTAHLKDREARLQYFADLQQWHQMIVLQDSKLRDGCDSAMGMLSVLKNSGYQFLLSLFIKSIDKSKESSEIDDFQYESAWRLADWNVLSSQKNTENRDNTFNDLMHVEKDSYSYYHYKCLRSFHEDDSVVLKSALDSARSSLIKDLRNISLDSCKAIYPSLTKLQMLQEIEELSSAKPHQYRKILSDWKSQDYIRTSEFQYIEPLLWQRSIMCKIKNSFKDDNTLKEGLIDLYLEIAEIAAQQGYFKEASRALGTLGKQEDLSLEMRNQLHYQESLLAWMNKDEGLARSLLRNLINRTSNNPRLHAESLRVYGNWMAESQSGNRQTILQKYYLESIKTTLSIVEPTSQDLKNLNNTQAALARFADVHYRQLKDYMQSPEYESIKTVAQLSLDSNKSDLFSKDYAVRTAACKNKRQTSIDAAVLEESEKEKNYFLLMALEYYVKALQQSEEHNFLIFRIVSLWVDNAFLPKLNEILNRYLPNVASYKFIQMLPQLAAHMSDEDDEFSSKINHILERCALDHPFHTLPVLLALKHLYEDSKFNPKGPKPNKPESRVIGATKLISKLSKTKINPIVQEMGQLQLALVQLAYLPIPNGAQKHSIPRNQEILKIKNFQNAIVPTITLDVRSNKKYDDVVCVLKYNAVFEAVGGINAPKKIICMGTDGICRKQLVKGKDDLRQDAVMQQVFSVINLLLKAKKETIQRKLNIRTYKVVPLTQRSGVLEWCENTVPMSTILLGDGKNPGMHKKYCPNDYSALKCRKMMEVSSKGSNNAKLKAYMECCKNFHPAFHHFFTETYSSPETWFERRLAYTRSVAVTSVVGYILGIGDRHLLNILLDQTTAEVIHIDFGISFEQGKILPVPELIPFRLTRDIEVAMGVSGVEGVMRRCCEQTMKVMRTQKEAIVTLLQVLLYDPLFTWSIPLSTVCPKSDLEQSMDSDLEINKNAERALVRVQQKLNGLEEAIPSSIEGQVERLIQQARDPALLSRIYFGWQAYM